MYEKILKVTLKTFQNKGTSWWGCITYKSRNGKILNQFLKK